MAKKENIKKTENASENPEGNSTTFSLGNVAKWGTVVVLAGTIFGGGYWFGNENAGAKCSESTAKTIGEYQKEREELKEELSRYKMQQINYASKEEVEVLRKSINEFYNTK